MQVDKRRKFFYETDLNETVKFETTTTHKLSRKIENDENCGEKMYGNVGDNDDDEDTIATFVTSSGQQLVLYSVENSEDFFAVGVYDESGQPPSHFDFLMKSDVEKLIGEGAIKTIKKPSQMKNQIAETPLINFSNNILTENYNSKNLCVEETIFKDEFSPIEIKSQVLNENIYSTCVNEQKPNVNDFLYKKNIISGIIVKNEEKSEDFKEQQSTQYNKHDKIHEKSKVETVVNIKQEKEEFLGLNDFENQYKPFERLQLVEKGLEELEEIRDLEFLEDLEDIKYDKEKEKDEYAYYEELFDEDEILVPNVSHFVEETKAKSTVEQMLFENNQSDLELTLNDIEKSLGTIIEPENESESKLGSEIAMEIEKETKTDADTITETKTKAKDKSLSSNYQNPSDILSNYNDLSSKLEITLMDNEKNEILINEMQSHPIQTQLKYHIVKNVEILKPTRRIITKRKQTKSALLNRRIKNDTKHTLLIHGTTALICRPIISPIKNFDLNVNTSEISSRAATNSSNTVKRPRKQQLTINDRTDSEIIIQPASLVSEDEDEQTIKNLDRKRVGRKNKKSKGSLNKKHYQLAKKKKRYSKKSKNERRRSPKNIELIEIDVDEDDNSKKRICSNIEEITIDDSKEKGSSDKENDVIMIKDSDDENDDYDNNNINENSINANNQIHNVESNIMKCDHCGRNFKKKKALGNHLRICKKNNEKLTDDNSNISHQKIVSNDSSLKPLKTRKKQFVCKICDEKFDVVVVLARHVRAHHSKKKQIDQNKNKNSSDNNNFYKVDNKVANKKQLSKLNCKNSDNYHSNNNNNRNNINSQRNSINYGKNMGINKDEILFHNHKSNNRHTNIKEKKEKLNSHMMKNKKMNCIDCGKWFPSAALLSAHYLQHATKTSDKLTRRCYICKKHFGSRLNYIRHLHTHNKKIQPHKYSNESEQQIDNKLMKLRTKSKLK